MMLLDDDVVANRQPLSGPFTDLFCSEEWIEYSRFNLAGYSGACIANADFGHSTILPGGDPDLPFMAAPVRTDDCLSGIDDEIQEDLIHFARHTMHGRQRPIEVQL